MKWNALLSGLICIGFSLGWGTAFAGTPQAVEGPPRDLDLLTRELTNKDAGKRRRAVRDLAQIGGRKAWPLVIEALADPKGEVADEAQFCLAGLDEPKLMRSLYGKQGLGSRDALLQARVAEALGRFDSPLDAQQLLKRVSRPNPGTSEMLLWSIERLARRGKLAGDLAKCGRGLKKLAQGSGSVSVRCQALCALLAVDEDCAREVLTQMLGDRVAQVRRTALNGLVRLDPHVALEVGARLRADESPCVRLAALNAIGLGRNKRSLLLLAERLELEDRYRLRVACVEELQQLSGRKHKLNPVHWQRWIESLPEDWMASTHAENLAEVGGTVSFAGLPVLSDRVCFLIDFSGSLWYEREGRPARKGKVDELVRASLPRLSAETEFNLIPYTGEPHPWRESLVEATPRNVRAAISDFEENTVRGSGNVFDAVLLALEDEATDRIVILTDGAPTGGARWKLDLMVPLLQQATRFNGVAIDAIVIDARPGLQKHWFRLAQSTGGRGVALDL
ncbi:MAG: HEAT repeat protein [Candidatus Paceibacteria bacterium]|jgi:HEAT repeat protein